MDIKVENKNLDYAHILLNSYTSEISEFSATSLYTYQHIVTNDKDFSKKILEIAIEEMRHIAYLGQTIKLLGVTPSFYTINEFNNINYWSSKNIDYSTDLENMLKANIKVESIAIKNYDFAKKMIKDKYIIKLLDYIISQEKQHLLYFTNYLIKIKNIT